MFCVHVYWVCEGLHSSLNLANVESGNHYLDKDIEDPSLPKLSCAAFFCNQPHPQPLNPGEH